MIGSARTLFVWSSFLATLAIVLWAVFSGTWIEVALLGGAAVGVAVTAGWILLRRSASPGSDLDVERPVTELSVATTCVAAALAAVLLGLQFGVWLVEVGGGLLVLAAAGIVRERRAEPRPRRSTPPRPP